MIEIIGAPFDLCGPQQGSRLGPPALRLAGLAPVLSKLGLVVTDHGDLPTGVESPNLQGMLNFDSLIGYLPELKNRTAQALDRGAIPLVLGGGHELAMGYISAALAKFDGDLALLWIDAHADANTPKTSPSGNIHGMPIAALQGLTSGVEGLVDKQWQRFLDEVVPTTRMRPERCAWYGLRDVDPGERDLIRRTPGDLAITMQDVDRRGVVETMREFNRWIRNTGAKYLWISFDVDVLDPILAPGTGTAVRGGLSYREGHLLAEMIREFLDAPDCAFELVGLDVVEVNPLIDSHNETAKMAVEWVGSLFGKSILGVH
ncbi:MAG: arginase [Chlorobia bacterium]|nr:arginase [Fimbriimonadaceae bacterium]